MSSQRNFRWNLSMIFISFRLFILILIPRLIDTKGIKKWRQLKSAFKGFFVERFLYNFLGWCCPLLVPLESSLRTSKKCVISSHDNLPRFSIEWKKRWKNDDEETSFLCLLYCMSQGRKCEEIWNWHVCYPSLIVL